jgi:hypothetical protein
VKHLFLPVLLFLSCRSFAGSACGSGQEDLARMDDPKFAASIVAGGMSATLVNDQVGNRDGTEVLFRGGERSVMKLAKGVHFRRADWSGFSVLNLDIENTSSTVMFVGINVMSKADSWEDGERAAFYARMAPGRATWRIPLRQIRYTNGWSWPNQPGLDRMGGWGRADISRVEGLEFSADHLASDAAIVFRGMTLENTVPSRGWVDRFGQDSCGSWPGKVASDMDIAAADLREKMGLSSSTVYAGRDEYGAWTEGPRRKPGRHFRVEKFGGKWWFVAPSGRPWLAAGMDCVLPGIHARMDQVSAAAYSWLPPEIGEFAGVWRPGEGDASAMKWPSFYRVNLVRKWGPDSLEGKWRERAVLRTRSWGFTCFGNWSDESLFKSGIPYFSVGPDIWAAKVPYVTDDIADAFHPGFETEAERAAEPLKKYRGDPWLVGHFVGNEMKWNDFPRKLLEAPADLPSKAAFIQKISKKYRTVAALNAAWGASATSFESLKWPGRWKANGAAKQDMGDFLMVFADRFIRGWARAVRKADPDHLILGTRFSQGNRPDEVVRAVARYMDVVSFNVYAYSPDRAEFDRLQALARRPFMVGEYGFNSLDDGLLSVAVPVRNRRERGVGYRYYTEQLAAIPYFVGGHYFQYLDEPVTGRFDRETSYNGFVNVADIPYQDLVDAAREANSRIYEIHAGKAAPVSVPPEQ